MNITRLIEPTPERPRDLPQCEWEIHIKDLHYREVRERRMERYGKNNRFCSHSATYKIGSKCYCAKHAGIHLLTLVEQNKIKIEECG